MTSFKSLLVVALCFGLNHLSAQDLAYVTADSGLTVREQPHVNARKVGKLYYGEALTITETTQHNLVIKEAGETIEGQWVKIQTPSIAGYVFNGYLSAHKMPKTIEFNHRGLRLKLKHLNSTDEFKIHTFHDTDTVSVGLSLGDSPEGKLLLVNNTQYKRVSIFQRYETSISILNEGPHCDLTKWEHYNSSYTPLEQLSTHKFRVLSYKPEEYRKFTETTIEALKEAVKTQCGEAWSSYIKDIKSLTDYPASIGISRIFLKIILTDHQDQVSEKIIEFELPMGC